MIFERKVFHLVGENGAFTLWDLTILYISLDRLNERALFYSKDTFTAEGDLRVSWPTFDLTQRNSVLENLICRMSIRRFYIRCFELDA